MKAILYARFSPRPDAATSDSCEKQLADLREYCRQHDIEIVGEFHDDAVSGAEAERPGLNQARSAVRRGYIFLVTRVDRLARDNGIAASIVNDITLRGGRVWTLQGPCNETPEQKLIRGVLQVLAEYQRLDGNRRTSRRMRQHQANGRRMSALCPYGWRPDEQRDARALAEYYDAIARLEPGQPRPVRPKRYMLPDEQEQAIIRLIVTWRKEGATYGQIIARLNEGGYRYRRGPWRRSTISRILKRASESAAV